MKKIVNSTHYVRDPLISIEKNDGVGVTVPDKALTLEELMERFVQGRDVSITPVITVPDDFDQIEAITGFNLQQLANMSKIERAELGFSLKQAAKDAQDQMDKFQDAYKNKKIAEANKKIAEANKTKEQPPAPKSDTEQPPSSKE